MSTISNSTSLTADVAVIGGGVAGSSVAAVLAQAGLGVVLIEREAQYRDRVRGESIHPWGVRELRALGLVDLLHDAGANELSNWANYSNRTLGDAGRYDGLGPGVPNELALYHPAMQTALVEHAGRCGVRLLRPARVRNFTRAPEPQLRVATETALYEVRARIVIGADGRHSTVRRWIGARPLHAPVHHQIGGCLLDGVSLAEDTFHTAGFAGGMVLIFPQGNGRVRTYVVGNDTVVAPLRGRARAADYIALCASIFPEGAFADARTAGPLAFFPNADVWADRLYHDRVVLIGDAAGANDPSGGHGLSLCFRDVREIRDHLLNEPNWDVAMRAYASNRATYYEVLRTYLEWLGRLITEVGPEAEDRRARVSRARAIDPSRGGFARMDVSGPDGLVVDEMARRHYFGEDLEEISRALTTGPRR
jgi:2-polyprenyl-6-methoxyphenol hydroxylase-like FAD-dependent oxidoreductase